MEKVEQIKDVDGYLLRMQKTVYDKLFFVDKIFEPIDYIVDFGCANGELIKNLQPLLPNINFVGYDLSEEMINAACENVPGVKFSSSWDNIKIKNSRALLNISSTIHEVYSYSTDNQIHEFWDRVFNSDFKYVAIRDMCVSKSDDTLVEEGDMRLLRSNKDYYTQLLSFEKEWGTIEKYREFIHFLLKYTYLQNWDREVVENYLPIYLEDLLKLIPDYYEIIYMEHY